MNANDIPDVVIDRLRANLRAAQIPFSEDDIVALLEGGMLRTAVLMDELSAAFEGEGMPDYLAADEVGAASRVSGGAERVSGRGEPRGPESVPRSAAPASVAELATMLRARDVSSVELLERSLTEISARDPELNAFQLVLAERARSHAARAEREIAAGEYRGPLHGVPVAVKDLFDLAGSPTAAGSRIRAGRVAESNSTVVERLESAGAVIVGKTRMPEFAYSPGSNNPHYGPTRNPWNHAHDAGGSSSGSGAAVAAGLVAAAVGSDTGGSVRIPAALCGIVGLKPGFGRVSLHGAVPLAWSLDHAGPMTRTVADAALLLEALAGPDRRDPRTRGLASSTRVTERGTTGLRVGVLRHDGSGDLPATDEVRAALRRGAEALGAAGASLDDIAIPEIGALRIASATILALEAAAYHAATLRSRGREIGPFMRQRLLGAYAQAPGAFVTAQTIRAELRRRVAAVFARIDLLVTPAQPASAPALGVPASTYYTLPANGLGLPAITVPVALGAERLPLAVQIIGRTADEGGVLAAAAAIERGVGRLGIPDAA